MSEGQLDSIEDPEGTIEELLALVSVHPGALQACAVRLGPRTVPVIHRGELCSSARGDCDDSPVPGDLDAAALEAQLHAACCAEVRRACRGGDAAAGDDVAWVSEWAAELGAGFSAQCMIAQDVQPDEGIPVLLQCGEGEAEGGEGGGQGGSAPTVKHLPPVQLSVHTHQRYPAAAAPALELYAPWLAPSELERLARALQQASSELGEGAPAMLAWVDALKDAMSAAILTAGAITISPRCGTARLRMAPGCDPVLVRAPIPVLSLVQVSVPRQPAPGARA
jgi:RWD domain